METIIVFISWCNANSGFFSLILSVIAIAISIVAINAQNKGVVFEQRVAIYYETHKIYGIIKRIVEVSAIKTTPNIKYLVAVVMFDYGSEESIIFQQLKKYDSANSEKKMDNQDKIDEMINQFLDIYTKKYMSSCLTEQAALFYGKDISDAINDLYSVYDGLLLGLIVMTPDEIIDWTKKANKIINTIDQKRVFNRMRKNLPI